MKRIIKNLCIGVAFIILVPLLTPVSLIQALLLVAGTALVVALENSSLKKLKTPLLAGVILYAAALFTNAFFPMWSSSFQYWVARLDYSLSSSDSLALRSEMTWDVYRAKHHDKMMLEFNRLLSVGDTEGAMKLKEDFFQKWDSTPSSVSVLPVSSAPLPVPAIEEQAPPEKTFGPYGRGVHQLDIPAGQRAKVFIEDCRSYNFNSRSDVTVYGAGQIVSSSDEGVNWPNTGQIWVKNNNGREVFLIVK